MSFDNIRRLIFDISAPITPSNAIIYDGTVNETVLQIRIVNHSYYYNLPENAKLKFYIDGNLIDDTYIKLVDRYKGLFIVELNEFMFNSGMNKQYEILLEIYQADTDSEIGESILTSLKSSIMYTNDIDTMTQSISSYRFPNTTTEIPDNPCVDYTNKV